MGGDAKGKGGGGKGGGKGGGGPPPKAAAPKKTKEEMAAEAKKKREEREAAQAKQRAEEKAHMEWLASLTTLQASGTEGVDWSQVEKQVLIPGGTSIFKMTDGKVASVRRVKSPGEEMMAGALAGVLRLPTAACRVVHAGDKEYVAIEEMTAAKPAFLDDMPMLFEEFISQMKEANPEGIPTEMKTPLIQAYEFTEPARGVTQLDLSAKDKGSILVLEFQRGAKMSSLCGKLSKDVLQSLGRLGVLGALLNGEDMLPLPVWRESGGMTHALKLDGKDDATATLATDLRVNPLKGEALAEYAKRLQLLASMCDGTAIPDIKGYPAFTSASIEAMTLALLKKIGFEVEAAEMAHVIDGLKDGVKAVVSSYTSGEFKNALEKVEADASKASPFGPGALTVAECKDFFLATAGALAGELAPASSGSALKLYGNPISQPSRAIIFLLGEAGLDYEFVAIDPMKGENKTESFLKEHPTGTIPWLHDGDFVLAEGAAILQYLCVANKLTKWWPEDVKMQAKITSWLHWNHHNTRKSTTQMLVPLVTGAKTNSKEVTQALDFIEARLGEKGPFLAGTASPTIADLMILPEVDQLIVFKLLEDFSTWPNVKQWLDRMEKELPKTYKSNKENLEGVAKALGRK